MEVTSENLNNLLQQHNLSNIEKDRLGFPKPGLIIRHFRERMTYTDNDGNTKHWTQLDLAKKLGLTEMSIRNMERQDIGLDSIERRRVLADLLKIPPVLLGLAVIGDTVSSVTVSNVITSKSTKVATEEISLYETAMSNYTQAYTTRRIDTALPAIETWIERITNNLKNVNIFQKPVLQRILFDFHMLSVKSYGYDICDFSQAFKHLDQSRKLAEQLGDVDLKVAYLYRVGDFRLVQGENLLAKLDFDNAYTLAKSASPQTRGKIYAYDALATALNSNSLADATKAQKLLDIAEKDAGKTDENSIITFGIDGYLKNRAETLIILGRYDKALDILDDYEQRSSIKNRLEAIKILRAECYIKQKKPDYDEATRLLSETLGENNTRRQYRLKHVERVYKLLTTSSYGNSPDVADLGLTLRDLQRR